MNKWQIICPLTALGIAVGVFAMISGSRHHRYYIQAQTRMIGEDLCQRTNSARLVSIDVRLQQRLKALFRAMVGVAEVRLGDKPAVGRWLGLQLHNSVELARGAYRHSIETGFSAREVPGVGNLDYARATLDPGGQYVRSIAVVNQYLKSIPIMRRRNS